MTNPDILLIEDDQRLAELTRDYLVQHGFQVAIEGHGDRAIARFRAIKPGMVLLDLSLPGKDGVEICREIRAIFSGPILMLTARDTNIDQVVGLEAGADDYITKPVDPMVLVARIRAVLRRENLNPTLVEQNISLGSLEINTQSRQVSLAKSEVLLTSMEFELLRILAENAGQVMSRDQLSLESRGIYYDGMDRTVDVRISRLRKKLGDEIDNPKRIRTVWGKGYLLAPDSWD